MRPRTAPHGTWTSPITAAAVARGSVALAEPELAGGLVWWVEMRPSEAGRQVLVRARLDGSERADAIEAPFSVRTRVHEYGGGSCAVHGRTAFFSNDDDGRVYCAEPAAQPRPLTPEPARPRALRYADLTPAPDGSRIWCVRESHAAGDEPVNEIVALPADGGEPDVLVSGSDFYAAPRPSPDGSLLAWLCWDHPRMPWDGTELWIGSSDGSGARRVAGGEAEAVLQPAWSPAGELHWVSDRSGWWNLYRGDGEPLHPAEAEFGAPLWTFGQSGYAFLDDGRIACAWTRDGFAHLGVLTGDGELEELEVPRPPVFRSVRIRSDGRHVAYVGAAPTRLPAVVVVDTHSGRSRAVAESGDEPDPAYVSQPEAIAFASGDRTAHALHYPPRNRDFAAPAGELPPLVVVSHGGPTAQSEPLLDLEVQLFTSRGFAVVDVNYGGSTGYGRAYRELLRGRWGVVDLEDCVEAALHLVRAGAADEDRLAIRGASAGGYTTLCALASSDVFDAGAVYYGVSDIEALFADTHKFESRYDEALVPREAWAERSPVNHVERVAAAVVVFQGLDDPVVPPAQAELIVRALARRGVEHEYHTFEGEAHGFRRAETIVACLDAELAFYRRVLGISAARAT